MAHTKVPFQLSKETKKKISEELKLYFNALKEKLSLDYAFANELEIQNGELTGKIGTKPSVKALIRGIRRRWTNGLVVVGRASNLAQRWRGQIPAPLKAWSK